MVVLYGLTNVDLNFLIKHGWQLFTHAGVVQFDEPYINFLQLGVFFLVVFASHEDFVNEAHHDGENQNTHELYSHGEAVLWRSVPLEVSITHGGESRHDPVDGHNIFGLNSRGITDAAFSVPDPTVFDVLSNADPSTGDEMHHGEKSHQEHKQVLALLKIILLEMAGAIELSYKMSNECRRSVEVHKPE